MNDEIAHFERLRDHVTNMTAIDMTSPIRTDEYVSLRAAFYTLIISYSKEQLTNKQMGQIIGRNTYSVMHYKKIVAGINPKTKFGKYYFDWVAKLEEIHPILKAQHRILCRALIGFL